MRCWPAESYWPPKKASAVLMTAFHFEELCTAWAAQSMLAILFVLKPVNNHNTAPAMQHIHSQLLGLQEHFDTDKNNRSGCQTI